MLWCVMNVKYELLCFCTATMLSQCITLFFLIVGCAMLSSLLIQLQKVQSNVEESQLAMESSPVANSQSLLHLHMINWNIFFFHKCKMNICRDFAWRNFLYKQALKFEIVTTFFIIWTIRGWFLFLVPWLKIIITYRIMLWSWQ